MVTEFVVNGGYPRVHCEEIHCVTDAGEVCENVTC